MDRSISGAGAARHPARAMVAVVLLMSAGCGGDDPEVVPNPRSDEAIRALIAAADIRSATAVDSDCERVATGAVDSGDLAVARQMGILDAVQWRELFEATIDEIDDSPGTDVEEIVVEPPVFGSRGEVVYDADATPRDSDRGFRYFVEHPHEFSQDRYADLFLEHLTDCDDSDLDGSPGEQPEPSED